MSVLVRALPCPDPRLLHVYVKGAPETIRKLCKPESGKHSSLFLPFLHSSILPSLPLSPPLSPSPLHPPFPPPPSPTFSSLLLAPPPSPTSPPILPPSMYTVKDCVIIEMMCVPLQRTHTHTHTHTHTVPQDFFEVLASLTQRGFRVLAVGHKTMHMPWHKAERVMR